MEYTELSALIELSNQLKPADIIRIQNMIALPVGLCEDNTQGTLFLYAVKRWSGHNPFIFYNTMKSIRPELVHIACHIPWLCVSTPTGCDQIENELSIKTLIELLKTEIPKGQWLMIYISIAKEAKEEVGFAVTLNMLMDNRYIERDLKRLSRLMVEIQRHDLVDKLQTYKYIFIGMEEEEFIGKLKKEIGIQAKEMVQWEEKLKQFVLHQFETVQEMVGSGDSVNLTDVYVDLTILKQKPRGINFDDETTYNEISFLRKIANKEVEITPVNFTEELTTYKSTKPETWCLIGNPGCGKTFLAKRTALRFSSSELAGILYSVSIPCRNPYWHSMEYTRHEEERKVDSEFIQNWLCLGLPIGPNWSKDLSKHLTLIDGEGLLLIIDGLDEFSKKFPFSKTFLFLLLTRQSLTRSTIILTSRPGTWTDISSAHELKIDRYYQVLGFSPNNRDLYFKIQITNLTKLAEFKTLLTRYDEINQLSLIPVNASLFAALMKGEDSTSINTLTKLYYKLTLYLIRRELTRMCLVEHSRVTRISYLHTDILECLHRIAFIAFLGVANRDLVSEETVPLIIGEEEYTGHCLGLAHEHYKRESVGLIKKVWTFPHLTMQEFTASLWLYNRKWTEQCCSIRYISHSSANISLFRMVVRFLCGLLHDKSAAVLSILYRYLTPEPIQLVSLPTYFQTRRSSSFRDIAGWKELSEMYLLSTAILYETNSASIPIWFNHFKQFFPYPLYLFIEESVSPNEWICFVQSLELLSQIQLIYISTIYINPDQFKYLLQEMKSCSVNYFTVEFGFVGDSTIILSYTNLFREIPLRTDTKISIELDMCDLTSIFLPTANLNINSLMLNDNEYSEESIEQLTNRFTSLEFLYFSGIEFTLFQDPLVLSLCQATQLIGFDFSYIPEEYTEQLTAAIPQFSNLQEIELDCPILPSISNLTNLTYFKVIVPHGSTEDTTLYLNLLRLINGNRDTVQRTELWKLEKLGFENWSTFLNSLQYCTNLVFLKLYYINLPPNDVTLWCTTINSLKLLVELLFDTVTLYDEGLLSVCQGLFYHQAIRHILIQHSKLGSLSYEYLIQLIPTLPYLKELTLNPSGRGEKLDPILVKLLERRAKEYSVKLS